MQGLMPISLARSSHSGSDNYLPLGQDWPMSIPSISVGIRSELFRLMSKICTPTGPAGMVLVEVQEGLRKIADRIPRLRDRGTRISEEDTKRVLITPIVEALGWAIYDT